MFEIEYKGANCVIITTKKAKIVTDPKLSLVGLKDIPTNNAIELITEERFATRNKDADIIIDIPGEFGVADLDIKGISAVRHIDQEDEPKQATIYRIENDDTNIGVIGNVSAKLSDEQLEKLGVLDVLILPVGGGGYTLDAQDAAKLVKNISPKVVIPIHYVDDAVKYEVPQDSLQLFIKEIGEPIEKTAKFKYKPQTSSTQQSIAVVELTRS